MQKRTIHIALFLTFFWTGFGSYSEMAAAAPVADELILKAKKIMLMPGTFDPLTTGHVTTAEYALQATGSDLVIVLPTKSPLHKQSLPLDRRLELVDLALSNDSRLLYPYLGEWRQIADHADAVSSILNRIQHINPNAEPALLVGQDVAEKLISPVLLKNPSLTILVAPRGEGGTMSASPFLHGRNLQLLSHSPIDTSSTQIRSILRKRFDLYLMEPSKFPMDEDYLKLSQLMAPKVLDRILKAGLYLDRAQGGSISPWKRARKWIKGKFTSALLSVGFYEEFKRALVRLVANPQRGQVEIHGTTYQVTKYLGSGLSADAFIIDFEGQKVVIKVARTQAGRESILRSVPIHLWAQEKFDLLSPTLIDYDRDGKWVMTELIDGDSLSSYLAKYGSLSDSARRSIIDIHTKSQEMVASGGVSLDFAPDNIIIKNEQAYLVDLGPIPVDQRLKYDIDQTLARWERRYSLRHTSDAKASARPSKPVTGSIAGPVTCDSLFRPAPFRN